MRSGARERRPLPPRLRRTAARQQGAKDSAGVGGEVAESSSLQSRAILVREMVATIALLAIPAFACKTMVVASFNVDVATAILANTSPTQLIYSSFAGAIPALFFLGAVVVARLAYNVAAKRRWRLVYRVFAMYVSLPLSLLSFLGLPVDVTDSVLILLGIPLLATVDLGRRNIPPLSGWAFSKFMAAYMSALFILVILAWPSMWLPAERIDVDRSPRAVYVLNDSGDDLVIFDHRQGAVLRIAKSKVENRQYCAQPENRGTLAQHLFGRPKGMPDCP